MAAWQRLHGRLQARTARLSTTHRGLLWSIGAGLCFSVLNATMRGLTQQVEPFLAQFLRYACGLLVLLPVVFYRGVATYRPKHIGGQFLRGGLHTIGLGLWFTALPRIPLADMTAIGFTTPLFIMIGAYFIFREPMRWERWLATALGVAGVLIVVGPKLSLASGGAGLYHLVMLASAPMFAASFLVTKAQTRYETTGTILVWQSLTVTLFSLPLALTQWQWLGPWQAAAFLVCGLLGSSGHYCITRSFRAADISATQSAKFLDLLWAVLLGWMVFGDLPTASTVAGGLLISVATLWVARRESRAPMQAPLVAP